MPHPAPSLDTLRTLVAPLFPGLMGVELVEATPERIVATLLVRDDLCTAGRILHGGALMAFADTLGALGTVMNLPPGMRTTTIESSTKFIAGAAAGTRVTGESMPFHRGRSTMVWQTKVTGADGRLCGVVTQTQMVLPVEGSAAAAAREPSGTSG